MRKSLLIIVFSVSVPFFFLFALIFSLIFYSQYSNSIHKERKVAYAALPTFKNAFSFNVVMDDGRAEKVRQFMERYHSPLEPYADDIVAAADMYGLDYRLLPAIAMQESGLCRVIPPGSNNCWGFGIYGSHVTQFEDYKEGIYTVTKTLATTYKKNGLVTPQQIMTIYTPTSNGSWAFSVNHFMSQLE